MVKKKLSGQTIAIIILAILLLLTIGFGGVYAFYTARSNKISGTIVMANLKIQLSADGSGDSGKTDIVISNGVNVVPGQQLKNSPLTVINQSSVAVYLVVVYQLNAFITGTTDVVEDEYLNPVLGLGHQYVNDANTYNQTSLPNDSNWVDYVFDAESVTGGEEGRIYRCLVLTAPLEKETNATVIEKDSLALHFAMGNEYQQATISMTFQAFAIGTESGFSFTTSSSKADKCREIVKAVYTSQDYKFLYGVIQKV